MVTEKLYLGEKTEQSINTAAEIIKNGGVVAMPTETVYGLAASAFCDSAIKKVFTAKGRPQDNPLIVHIADINELTVIAKDISEKALMCAKKFWPGPFTMVVNKTNKVCESVSCGLNTVAVRMPNNQTAINLIKACGLPLAAPSANSSGSPSPTTAQHVINDLDGKIDAVLMGERCEVGVESTVVSFCGENPVLLRPGAVTFEQLKEIVPNITVDPAVFKSPEANQKVLSPGMKYKHYSPLCQLVLVEGGSEDFCRYVNQKGGFAVCFNEDTEHLTGEYQVYGKNENDSSLAYSLFHVLRELDEKGIKEGYVHAPQKNGVGLAVYNRLIRACAYRVVKL